MKRTVLAALVCAILLQSGCGREAPAPYDDVRPVRTAIVGATNGSVGATYSGEVLARYESRLAFQVSGKIVARHVEVGSPVKRGQLLMRLDPAQETLHLAAATADVEAARSRVAQNKVDLERAEQLLARRFASQAEVDQQRLALAQAESQLAVALAQQEIRQNQRGYTTLAADRQGVVSAIGAEAGQVVAPGQAVVTVAADGEREVRVSIPESRVDELRRARTLRISIWAQPGKTYAGALRELAPDTDSVTRTYSARITVKDADAALRLGMTASVHAPDVEGRSAIRLPLTAIYDKDGAPQVWIVDGATSRVAARPVTLGAVHQDSVLVAGGLEGGETVVTAGAHLLHAGQRVRLAGEPAGAAAARAPAPGAKATGAAQSLASGSRS